jgi:hypothetical protein
LWRIPNRRGQGIVLKTSLLGGTNFAFGGAQTGNGNYLAVYPGVPPVINAIISGPPSFPAAGMLAQVPSFGGTFGPQSLVVH